MKICNGCNLSLSYKDFQRDSKKKDGLRTTCKTCRRGTQAMYFAKNKARLIEQQKKWYRNNAEYVKAKRRERYILLGE